MQSLPRHHTGAERSYFTSRLVPRMPLENQIKKDKEDRSSESCRPSVGLGLAFRLPPCSRAAFSHFFASLSTLEREQRACFMELETLWVSNREYVMIGELTDGSTNKILFDGRLCGKGATGLCTHCFRTLRLMSTGPGT